jgi:hypothetical protein
MPVHTNNKPTAPRKPRHQNRVLPFQPLLQPLELMIHALTSD